MTDELFTTRVVRADEAIQEVKNLEVGISKRTTRRMYTASLILTRTIRRLVTGTSVFKGSESRVRTGKFAQAWQSLPVQTRGKDVVAGSFSSHPGAALQEYGGDIVPKNVKALTIPVTKEASRARAGDFDLRAEYFPSKNPDIIGRLVEKSNPDQTMYLLAKKTHIKAKNYLFAALKEATPEITEQIDQGVKDELNAFAGRA